MSERRERELERAYPWIDWGDPVKVSLLDPPDGGEDVVRFGCRYCIAMKGLKGSEVAAELWQTEAEAVAHIEAEHR